MRRAFKGHWLGENKEKPHEGSFMGINFGADFVAEHEWGVKGIYRSLGINQDSKVIGMERYRVVNIEEGTLSLLEEKSATALILQRPYNSRSKIDEYRNLQSSDEFVTAWSEDDFGIKVSGEKNIKKLKRIHEAILNKDAAIWVGGGHIFANGGLVIGIISLIPQEMKGKMAVAHTDRQKLEEASEKTGIKQKIDSANKKYVEMRTFNSPFGYFALSPSWKGGQKTKHPVVYWLNPQRQDEVNYGSFTVEELEQWLEGKGPIPKTEAQRRKR